MSVNDLITRIEQAKSSHQNAINLFAEARELFGKILEALFGSSSASEQVSPKAPVQEKPPTQEKPPAQEKPPDDAKVKELEGDLQKIMPNANPEDIKTYSQPLSQAMQEHGINTPERQRAFLAQLAHESGSFRYKEEIASGAAYEGRKDLGNTQPGDGERYKGRGLIQLTGRANYRAVGNAIGIDLENHPEKVMDPNVSAKVAAHFWQSRGLNELADQGNFREITRRINGGYNGYEDRLAYYERAQSAIN